jgi:putative ABC transport system permease protein
VATTADRIVLPHDHYADVATPAARSLSRPLAILLAALVAAIAAIATIVVAAELPGGSNTPADGILAATNPPNVQVSALPGVDLRPVTLLPGLSASSGPFPNVDSSISYRGREVGVRLEGRPAGLSVVDHPKLVAGGWVRPGAVVLEQKLAKTSGLRVGDHVRVTTSKGPLTLSVAGIAATAASERYPSESRGLAYVLPETLSRIVPNQATYGSTLLLRLSDAGDTGMVVKSIRARYPGAQVVVHDFKGVRGR